MNKVFLVLTMVFILIVGTFAFAETYPTTSNWGPAILNWGSNVKYGGTFKGIDPAGSMALNFNPFSSVALDGTLAMYENLFYINALNGDITPLLGTSYNWSNNNKILTIAIRNGVKWSDGTPFTAQDVAFTFNYIKKYPALDSNGIWSPINHLESVSANGNKAIFEFSTPNVPFLYFISLVPIIPEHIWSDVNNPTEFINPNPVGTGPFIYKNYDSANKVVTYVKNPIYWMTGRPYIDKVEIQSMNSNVPALLSMLKHEADYSYMFTPDVKSTWYDKDPSINKYWWPAGNINVLYLNTQKYPFNNPTFRKAIALAINKESLEKMAYYDTGNVANQTGIIPSQLDEWLDPSLKNLADSFNYNPDEAQKLLSSIGFKKDSAGNLLEPNGKQLPTFKILVGSGWTDFITMAQLIQENLKILGISTIIDQENWGTYIGSVMSGTYDMVICWGTGTGSTPYYLYYNEFEPSLSATEIGKNALSGYSRYVNSSITSALMSYSQTTNSEQQKQAIYTIEKIMLQDVPFIPLTSRTAFNVYSEQNLLGWPSNEHPYFYGNPLESPSTEILLLNLHTK